MKFTKYTGLGNDFIIVNGFKEVVLNPAAAAVQLCDRRFGVGADGLVLILPSSKADFRMQIMNSDGSEPEMCGNATRCVALYLLQQGLTDKKVIKLETLAGIIVTEVLNQNEGFVVVDMGTPRLLRGQIGVAGDPTDTAIDIPLDVNGTVYYGTAVSMGNPHFVMFVKDLARLDIERIGRAIEMHPLFAQKTNVEFVQIIDDKTIRMRVWERGAGITKACGTGACASVVACALNLKTSRQVQVKLDGGDLFINWQDQKNIFMVGPAAAVFEGEFLQKLEDTHDLTK